MSQLPSTSRTTFEHIEGIYETSGRRLVNDLLGALPRDTSDYSGEEISELLQLISRGIQSAHNLLQRSVDSSRFIDGENLTEAKCDEVLPSISESLVLDVANPVNNVDEDSIIVEPEDETDAKTVTTELSSSSGEVNDADPELEQSTRVVGSVEGASFKIGDKIVKLPIITSLEQLLELINSSTSSVRISALRSYWLRQNTRHLDGKWFKPSEITSLDGFSEVFTCVNPHASLKGALKTAGYTFNGKTGRGSLWMYSPSEELEADRSEERRVDVDGEVDEDLDSAEQLSENESSNIEVAAPSSLQLELSHWNLALLVDVDGTLTTLVKEMQFELIDEDPRQQAILLTLASTVQATFAEDIAEKAKMLVHRDDQSSITKEFVAGVVHHWINILTKEPFNCGNTFSVTPASGSKLIRIRSQIHMDNSHIRKVLVILGYDDGVIDAFLAL